MNLSIRRNLLISVIPLNASLSVHETIHAATLWIAMTWLIDVIQVAPLLSLQRQKKVRWQLFSLDVSSRTIIHKYPLLFHPRRPVHY